MSLRPTLVGTIVPLCITLTSPGGTSLAVEGKPARVSALSSSTIELPIEEDNALTLIPRDSCSSQFQGLQGLTIPGWITGNETYYKYIDPSNTSCNPDVPLGITGMKIYLCYGSSCNTNILFSVHDAIGTSCPIPGTALYTSPAMPLQVTGGPSCIQVNYSFDDTVCVNAPFFLAYTFPDPTTCFNPVTDTSDGACISYELTSSGTLLDLHSQGFPGQLWMQAIGLDSAQSQCPAIPDTLVSITDVYQNIDSMSGKTIRVLGQYVHPSDNKMVTSFGDYELQQLMPLGSIMYLTGLLPDSLYWRGGVIAALGNISSSINPSPVYPNDTLIVTMNVLSYEYFMEGDTTTKSPTTRDQTRRGELEAESSEACDPCKFAILISGGGNAQVNKQGYWKDIERMYLHKTGAAGGYCPENIKILYFDGNSPNPSLIPDSVVDPCTKANIGAAHTDFAARIAACEAQGKQTTVQKMITNHGVNDAGIVTTGVERVSPIEFKNMQQLLIDAGCDYLLDEFVTCFGGDMLEGLKGLNDKGRTEIHVNSAAGTETPAVADPLTGSRYLEEKTTRLEAGDSYEEAVAAAKIKHTEHVSEIVQKEQELLQRVIDKINSFPLGHPDRKKWEDLRDDILEIIDRLQMHLSTGSLSFVRHQFNQYCEWKEIVIPPPGQFEFTFSGSGGCGNVSIYSEDTAGVKTRVKVWNWNLPTSYGYANGNEVRVLNVDTSDARKYLVHNDNGEFTVTVASFKTQLLPESASNPQQFSGFSMGGTDSSNAEFGNIVQSVYSISRLDSIGLDLPQVPSVIGNNGVSSLSGNFALYSNQWHDSMEVIIRVNQVTQPGILQLECTAASIPLQQLTMGVGASEVHLNLGTIQGPALAQMTFTALNGLEFSWDSWGLTTRKITAPQYSCGDADGNELVNISDAVYIINYVFSGGPAPNPIEAADVDCNGLVTISDVVYLIQYTFGGGPQPCAACP